MELKEVVLKRRSVRKFIESSISLDDIKDIVSFSQNAPSWKNSQTPRYYVAFSNEAKKKVFDTLPDFNQESSKNSSCYIITTFVKTRSGFERDGSKTNECGDEWGAYDLGLANELLLLRATELGYSSLVMGIRDSGLLKEYFNIADTEEVMSVIAIGKQDLEPVMPKRKEIDSILKIY